MVTITYPEGRIIPIFYVYHTKLWWVAYHILRVVPYQIYIFIIPNFEGLHTKFWGVAYQISRGVAYQILKGGIPNFYGYHTISWGAYHTNFFMFIIPNFEVWHIKLWSVAYQILRGAYQILRRGIPNLIGSIPYLEDRTIPIFLCLTYQILKAGIPYFEGRTILNFNVYHTKFWSVAYHILRDVPYQILMLIIQICEVWHTKFWGVAYQMLRGSCQILMGSITYIQECTIHNLDVYHTKF